ncbi:hypothetical protein T492DRAFT_835055 [Pavlovales sp. CCMP2436]|nr:hypothetical protein T492DRAFT_835055 [Pavlovales sp. CCMP2436]
MELLSGQHSYADSESEELDDALSDVPGAETPASMCNSDSGTPICSPRPCSARGRQQTQPPADSTAHDAPAPRTCSRAVVFNPMAHSWIIVTAEEHNEELSAPAVPAEEQHEEPGEQNGEPVQGDQEPAAQRAPVEAEVELPDGVSAWTQVVYEAAEPEARASAMAVASPRAEAHFVPATDCWAHLRQHKRQQRQLRQRRQLEKLGQFSNWNDASWKWLLVTNCASVLIGVYLGSYNSTSCECGDGGSCVVSREVAVPVTYRVA